MTPHLRPPLQVKKVKNVQFGVFDPDLLVRPAARLSQRCGPSSAVVLPGSL